MYKSLSVAFIALFAFFPAYAADLEREISHQTRPRTMEVSINPVGGLFLARISGAYKIKVAEHIALTVPVSASVWNISTSFGNSQGSFTTWAVYSGLGARFYLSNRAFESGWFVDTVFQVGYSVLDQLASAVVLNPYALAGYGWVFDSGLTINLGLGMQYNYYSAKATNESGYAAFPLPVLEASLGYSW